MGIQNLMKVSKYTKNLSEEDVISLFNNSIFLSSLETKILFFGSKKPYLYSSLEEPRIITEKIIKVNKTQTETDLNDLIKEFDFAVLEKNVHFILSRKENLVEVCSISSLDTKLDTFSVLEIIKDLDFLSRERIDISNNSNKVEIIQNKIVYGEINGSLNYENIKSTYSLLKSNTNVALIKRNGNLQLLVYDFLREKDSVLG